MTNVYFAKATIDLSKEKQKRKTFENKKNGGKENERSIKRRNERGNSRKMAVQYMWRKILDVA